jgi:hypothetical protein
MNMARDFSFLGRDKHDSCVLNDAQFVLDLYLLRLLVKQNVDVTCEILGCHSGAAEDSSLQGCYAISVGKELDCLTLKMKALRLGPPPPPTG